MSRLKGDEAESAAAAFLRAKGLRILERNFRRPFGEIDLIARDGDTMVFVEVKSRAGSSFGGPEAAVDGRKRRRLVKTALAWAQSKGWDGPMRFDVVGIEAGEVRHLPDAFGAQP
ncbi:MAG: YraN family protein [Elusimicrobia bacterium]|nr:YraN family protein [Elusimicrobiota bacterium]